MIDVIRRASARIAQLRLDAVRLDEAAQRSAAGAQKARLDVLELERFIELATELAGEPDQESQLPVEPAQSRAAPSEVLAEAEGNRPDREPPGDEGSQTDPVAKASTGNGATLLGADGPETSAGVSGEASRLSDGSGTVAATGGVTAEPAPVAHIPGIAEMPPETEAAVLHAAEAAAAQLVTEVSTAPTLVDRIRAYQAEHPDATAREMGDAFGVRQEQVNAMAQRAGITIRRLTPEERAEAQRKGGAEGAARAGQRETIVDRVVKFTDAVPDATERDIAAALGLTVQQVHSAVKQKDIPVRKLTPEERSALMSKVHAERQDRPAVAKPTEPDKEKPNPTKFVRKDTPAPVDVAVVEDTGPDFIPPTPTPRPKPPKGQKFRLRVGRGEGKYLHMSCVGFTASKSYAWSGTEQQMAAVRGRFGDARDLYEEPVVEPIPERA